MRRETRLATSPTPAMPSSSGPFTPAGALSRCHASTPMPIAMAMSRAPFTSAARISSRSKPNDRSGVAGRCATRATNSARPSAAASASMCPASASKASEPAIQSLGLRLLAVIVLIAANAFFVAAEFALVAARRTRIEALIRRGDRKAKTVQQALADLYRQLSVAHLFREWFATLPAALSFLTRGGVASVVAVAVITFLHVVFGEQAPKAWAITYPEGTSRWVAAPLILFSWITRPFTDLLNWSANGIVRLMGIKSTNPEHDRVHSPEEIRMLVQQSRKTGGLSKADARMLEGVFEFSEKNARDVMTPRTDMVALPAGLTLPDAADAVATAGRSRYPVYGESLDDIVGTVHAKDILRELRAGKAATVKEIARPAFFVPGTREVEDVLTDMKRQKVHLAIVLDEFGGTAGLVTMEDL